MQVKIQAAAVKSVVSVTAAALCIVAAVAAPVTEVQAAHKEHR